MGKNKRASSTSAPKAVVEEKVTPVPEVEPKKEEEIVDAVVDGVDNMLNIRSTPEVKDGNVITAVKKGTYIQVVDSKKETNGFYKIVVKDPEVKGFAMKKYIKII